jgi:hypothetical protein
VKTKWICSVCGRGYAEDPNRTAGGCACGSLRVVLRSVAADLFGEQAVQDLENEARMAGFRMDDPSDYSEERE